MAAELSFTEATTMPHKARLLQAIRDEDAKLMQHRAFHIVGPGVVILVFAALAGELAVRVVKAPALFGGGTADLIGYGLAGVLLLLGITKGYAFDKWAEGWQHLQAVHDHQVGKIRSAMELLDAAESVKDGAIASGDNPPQDAWQRALRQPRPSEERAA
jgi:hypothetical protein